jgi:hypothetical protein
MRVPEQRIIGGISCFGVLDRLSDYLDGTLAADDVKRINERIVGCDQCRRFGGAFQDAGAQR